MSTAPAWDLSAPLHILPGAHHPGGIHSLISTVLPDGRAVLISGGGDGTIRRWDAATGQPIGDPLTGHTNWIYALTTATLPDGRLLLASGSADASIWLWPLLATGQVAGEDDPPPDTNALSRTDEVAEDSFRDQLGRGVLAAHLEELLARLTERQRAGTAVIHIDGR